MKKLITIQLIDIIILLVAGNVIAVLAQSPSGVLGVFWFLVAFLISYALSRRSLLSHFWMVIGLTMNPPLFLDLGIYKTSAHQIDITWGMAVTTAFDMLVYFAVMHLLMRIISYTCKRVKIVLVAAYSKFANE